MRRRDFIVGTSGLVVGLSAGWFGREWALRPRPRRAGTRLGADAWTTIEGLEHTDALADPVMDAMAGTADPLSVLERGLVKRLGIGPDLEPGDFADRLSAAIRQDFKDRRFCKGTPWLASELECQVAALRRLKYGSAAPVAAMEPEAYAEGTIVEVVDWGQRETEVDTPFNVQSDGHSGIWIKAKGAPPWLRVEIGGEQVSANVSENVITTGLYGDLQGRVLSREGEYPIALIDEMSRVRQPLGVFVVRPRTPRLVREDGTVSKVYCPIEDWGPRSAQVGSPANPQPGGREAFWIKTACAPSNARVFLGQSELRTTVSLGLITASVPTSLLAAAGSFPVELHDRDSGETVFVGMYELGAASPEPPRP